MHVPTRFLKLFHQPIRVKILRVNTRKTSTSYAIGCYTTCRKRLSDWYFSVDISKQQLNVVQLNIVASLWFFSAQLPSHCIRSVYSLSVFCNVVHANTLVLMAHLVTFSESQWDQFHPRAKKPTAPWGSPWPPQLLCTWTALHTPRHVPLVSHLLQNSARTNSQNDHLIITFVTNHYICNKCINEVNSYTCTKLALH